MCRSYRDPCLPAASASRCRLRAHLVPGLRCLTQLHVEAGSCKHFRQSLLARRSLTGRMFTVHGKPGRAADEASAPEIVEGGLFQSVGNLCFRSTYSDYLWKTSVSAPYRVIRVAAMTLISLLLLARSWRLFVR